MHITIKTLTGKAFLIRAKGTDTIDDVKLRIQNEEAIACCEHSKAGSKHNFDKFPFFD